MEGAERTIGFVKGGGEGLTGGCERGIPRPMSLITELKYTCQRCCDVLLTFWTYQSLEQVQIDVLEISRPRYQRFQSLLGILVSRAKP